MNIDMLEALKQLRKHAVDGTVKWSYGGICLNLDRAMTLELDDGSAYHFVSKHSVSWEHFKKGSTSCHPISSYEDEGGAWTGKSLEMRISLIDHLIGVLEETL